MLIRKHFSPVFFVVPVILFLALNSSFLQNLPAKAVTYISSVRSQVSLTPDEIVARARAWVAAKVTYSQNVQPQYRFQNYRADCSGLVTMAWGIPATPPNYGLSTGSLSNAADILGKALDDSGQPIIATMNKLQKGDILLNQGSDAHVILFVGWIDIAKKIVVDHPIRYTDGKYYYDGIEENGGYGYAVEHTPNYPVDTQPFDFHQPWPFPYDPGYDPGGYYAWRFDPVKAATLGYTGSGTPGPGSSIIKPGGEWMPPSPKDGAILTDNTLHLAATAYPTNKGDPGIATVHFTIKVNGAWIIVCSLNTPSKSGSEYTCDVELETVQLNAWKIHPFQVSFDVIDKQENVNLTPNGVHTIYYFPIGNMAGFSQFVGLWKYYGTGMIISSDGKALYEGRTHVFCSEDPRPPCDGGSLGLAGLYTTILYFNVAGSTAQGTFIAGTGDRDINNNIIPVRRSIMSLSYQKIFKLGWFQLHFMCG